MDRGQVKISSLKVIPLFVLLSLSNSTYAAYRVIGDAYAYALGSGGPITYEYNAQDVTQSGDIQDSNLPLGNLAHAWTVSDIPSASVYANTGALSVQVEQNKYSATARVSNSYFSDDLFFTVPAGVYTDGLSITLVGKFSANLSASNAGASALGGVMTTLGGGLGGDDFSRDYDIPLGTGGGFTDGGAFSLTAPLLNPDTSLLEDDTIKLTVAASASSWSSAPSLPTVPAGGSFANLSLGFYDVIAPEYVSWTSASGEFLVSPVPELHTWAMMSLGLAMLGWKARRASTKLAH